MKNLGLIMLLLFSLVGCKTRNSHVLKSSYDSSYVNRGINNVDLVAVSTRGINGSVLIESDWKNLIRLSGFTGTISPEGKIEGTAEDAQIEQSGNRKERNDQAISERDSTNIRGSSETVQGGEVKKESMDKGKQTEGFDIPWYAWLFAVGGILLALSIFKR
ncbi:hypothetical protein ACF3OC_08005 [Sphingobacterium cellulitidis]|uniref:hypothetical protein n=1 Tax=Sphingobacterium cellulitidis TaxID=1768011 RepID=UPI00370D5561